MQKLFYFELIRPDAAKRRNGTVQHVIGRVELICALQCEHVAWVFHHADNRAVSAFIAAHGAKVAVRQIAAHGAVMDLLMRVDDRLRKAFGIRFIHVEHGIRNALCGLMPHARQALKFIDEPFERRYVITGH